MGSFPQPRDVPSFFHANTGESWIKGEELIQMVLNGSSRMKGLIDGVLTYSHAGKGDHQEIVNTRTALQQALTRLAPAVRESQAEITVVNLPSVRFDPAQFEQILQHLVGNAIKYRGAVPAQGATFTFSVPDLEPSVPRNPISARTRC